MYQIDDRKSANKFRKPKKKASTVIGTDSGDTNNPLKIPA